MNTKRNQFYICMFPEYGKLFSGFFLLPGSKFTNLRRIFSNLIQIPLSNTRLLVQRAACSAVEAKKKKKNCFLARIPQCGTRVPTDWPVSKHDGIFISEACKLRLRRRYNMFC